MIDNFFAEEEEMEGKLGDKMKTFLSAVPVYPAKPMKCVEISKLCGVRSHLHLLPILAPIFIDERGRIGYMSLEARNHYFQKVGIDLGD